MDVDLTALRMLVAVVEAGSMNAAAGRLGVSAQAVSSRMRRLETSIGTPLLRRSARGIEPTGACEAVAGWARELLDTVDDVGARIDALAQRTTPPLRVAASLTVAEHLMPRWLLAWRERSGTAHLAVANSTEVIAAVRAGDADLGFVETTDLPADLRTELVARDELVVAVGPEHPWAGRTDLRLAEVAAAPLVVREAGSGTRAAFEHAVRTQLGSEAAIADPAHVATTSASVRVAVHAGVGPAVLSGLAVRDDVALGRLVVVPLADARLVRPLSAVRRDEHAPAAAFLAVARATTVR